jgi:hypothetical protein
MNIYFCTDCGSPADPPECPKCGSHLVHMAGDLHLTMLGLDVYVNVFKDALGAYYLIIKKPSGQKEIRLQDIDLIVDQTTFDYEADNDDPGEHFMDGNGRPQGYELEQLQAEMEVEAQWEAMAAMEDEAHAEVDLVAWFERQGYEPGDADPDPAYSP